MKYFYINYFISFNNYEGKGFSIIKNEEKDLAYFQKYLEKSNSQANWISINNIHQISKKEFEKFRQMSEEKVKIKENKLKELTEEKLKEYNLNDFEIEKINNKTLKVIIPIQNKNTDAYFVSLLTNESHIFNIQLIDLWQIAKTFDEKIEVIFQLNNNKIDVFTRKWNE